MKNKLFTLMRNNEINIDFDTFSYGYEIFKQYFLFLIFIIPMSIIFDTYFESILFLVFLIFIRRYNGGFHFNNKYYCLISSILITLIFPKLSKIISFSSAQYLLCISLSIIITLILGVVDHQNKKISSKEKTIYLKYCIFIEFIYSLFIFFILNNKNINNKSLANIILLVLMFNSLNVIVGKIHQSIRNNRGIIY